MGRFPEGIGKGGNGDSGMHRQKLIRRKKERERERSLKSDFLD